jgi:hypothetical protein
MSKHHDYNPNIDFAKLIFTAFAVIAIALAIVLNLISCSPVGKMARLEHKHPFYVAEFCANKYPTQEKVVEKIEYKEGETKFDTSFVQIDCDSAIKYQTRWVNVPKFIQKLRIDTLYSTKETVVKSTAEMKQIAILQNDNDKLHQKYSWWMKFGIVTAACWVIFIAYKIFWK